MSQDTAAEPPTEAPARKKPGRKPGVPQKPKEARTGPIRSVAMNPLASGMALVEIRMELPLTLAIELVSAAAQVQAKGDEDNAGKVAGIRTPFPSVTRG